ncbi:MAG: glucose/mannose-6-phosphate isomerase [Flavobacteriales bacterium]|jgi:glucose/mannose-6-phosphate isomerase
MRELVGQFPKQLEEALVIGAEANLKEYINDIDNVLITGLGGSGIGGKIVSQLIANECPIPITINNTYDIPAFVNEKTLVIASSFSGNTEETLYALQEAFKRNAEVAVITSGGEILKIAQEKGLNHIILPTGKSPRAMLSYSLTQQFYILHHYGLIGGEFVAEIEQTINLLNSEADNIESLAGEVAKKIENKTPIIYSSDRYEGVAIRLRQQLNENAKVLCWHHALPEMNHNELVGWAGGNNEFAVICFRNDDDFLRTQVRMDITRDVISKITDSYIEISSKGETRIEKSLYLIFLGDWISVILSELKGVDPIEVEIITHLKGELAKI